MSEAEEAIRAAAAAIVQAAAAAAADPGLAAARVAAIYWATVELDRAERELGLALGDPLDARAGPRDAPLGAVVRTSRRFCPPPGPRLQLVEPDTEGRLAALLARHGDGVVAVDVTVGGRTRRLEITSDRGGRPPRAPSGRPPSAAG